MKFFIDLSKKQLIKSAASNVALDRLVLKRRDSLSVEIVFVSRNAVASMPPGTTVSVALKKSFADSNFLASASGTPPILNLNTVPLEALFTATATSAIPALLEIRWTVPGETTRTATLTAEVQNSVILGTEATPEAIPDGKATQAQAESGTDNAAWMTPLRTAQAIQALAATDWDSIAGKPSVFPPEAHTHPTSEITGLDQNLANLEAADLALGQRIDSALANLDPAAIDSIAEAVTTINTERTERIAADTALDTKITAETTGRTTALTLKADLVNGLVPTTQLPPLSFQTTRYDGDGTAFTFAPPGTLTNSDSPSAISVTINGVTQEPGSDYTLNIATNRVVLTSALPLGDKIVITRPILLPSNSTLTAEQLGALTATSVIDGGSF